MQEESEEPAAKKMWTKSPNSGSMSQHMSDQARDGLEQRIGDRKRAAEVKNKYIHASLGKCVLNGFAWH